MAGRFEFDSRVLMCGNCGGPLQTGHTGGNVTCDYCGTLSVFTPRREDPVEPVAAVSNMSEEERIALLNRQDGSPPAIPAAVSQLLSRGRLAPWKESEALAMWRTTCGELARGSDFSSAELLYFLTIVLSNHYSVKNDPLRQRALFESALEVLTLPRHRQVIRGMLARYAALEGDTDAAEKWLEPCDPRSPDLESDSSYRVSRAEIETVKGNWNGVLEVLGVEPFSVPIVSLLDGKAIVQRANALERTGRPAEAAKQLDMFIQANGADGADALKQIVSVYAASGLAVCAAALPIAFRTSSARAGKAQADIANPGGFFGQVFAVVGALLILLAVILPPLLKRATGALPTGAWIGLGSVGLMGVVFAAIGINCIRDGRKARMLHASEIDATGVVRRVTATGIKVNGVPQYILDMDVTLPGENPYSVKLKRTIRDSESDSYRKGAVLPVKIHPHDRKSVTLLDFSWRS